jgi:acyl dehydratase
VHETIADSRSGDILAEMSSTVICRGEGGRGGTATADILPPPDLLPERAPDLIVVIPGQPQQALLYRLSGDLNPLHSDPAVARKAGFDRPVLHGLASFGMACRVLIERLCGGDSSPFRAMHARFSRPLFPGEDTELAIWRDSVTGMRFRLNAVARGVTVLDQGRLELAAMDEE